MVGGFDDEDDERTTNPNRTVVTVITAAPKTSSPADGCLVVIYGDDLGRRISLGTEPCIVGRSSKADLQIEQESVSRAHAELIRKNNRYYARDLGSLNGTYVNDEVIAEETQLRDGDQIKIGRTIFKFIVGSNMESQYHEEIYRLMTVDGLTELHNKRFFTEALDREVSRCRRYHRAFSVVLFDVDHFKKINDTYGHLAGDAVLRRLGVIVRTQLRRDDIPARTGGEEFSIIVPEANEAAAALVAEKVRRAVEIGVFKFEATNIPVTVSLGIAEWKPTIEDPADLIKLADERLYAAKRNGRNQVGTG